MVTDDIETSAFTTRLHTLTARERDITHHIARGRTNREVADALGISTHTVRNTLSTIFIKTGAPNRVVLARMYLTGRLDPSHRR